MVIQVFDGHVFNIVLGLFFLGILVYGAEKLIERTILFARRLRLSELFIGLTLISIGTSVPEIFTAIVGSIDILRGELSQRIVSATVIGTNVGSDIFQQTIILGIVGLLAVMKITKKTYHRDIPMLIAVTVLVLILGSDGLLGRGDGLILLIFYSAYLWDLWREETRKKKKKVQKKNKITKLQVLKDLSIIAFWLAAVIISAEEILRLSNFFVDYYHVGGSLIGVLIIGVATALPELTTSVTAILKRSTGLSIGTLIGSNITNPALGLGLGAAISTYIVPRATIVYDLPAKIIIAVLLMLLVFRDRRISTKESIALIALYIIFVIIRLKYFSVDVLF